MIKLYGTLICCTIILASISLTAQNEETGRLAIRVRDNHLKPLQYVRVDCVQDSVVVSHSITDERGLAIIPDIPAGLYDVTFQLLEYRTVTRTDIRIEANYASSLYATMTKETEIDSTDANHPSTGW